ncbi:MAG: 16S rRNA (cytidine(1402)-2'-O)-methyltransferase [Proteobacteria bacterium]|nr:16S rRNA (cytidine(1402)-2'-O)-methyltransferase [Pseudomonadota bacterium]
MSATPESKRSASGADRRGPEMHGAGHWSPEALESGLYLVATPIGNAADITLRALDVLARADAIAAEDTRRTRKLMTIHGIALAGRPMVSYHDRNGAERRPRILAWLREGMSVAYCSDAGTPLVADPGYRLAEAALAEGLGLTAIPGASALLTALSLAGLPADRFLFAGFLPPKPGARKTALGELAAVPATLVFYESPRRLAASLADMVEVLGGGRAAAVARELTKKFEQVRRAPLGDLARQYAAEDAPKGEVVVLVGPPDPATAQAQSAAALDDELVRALASLSVKDAAREVAARLGLPRREVYARALELARR